MCTSLVSDTRPDTPRLRFVGANARKPGDSSFPSFHREDIGTMKLPDARYQAKLEYCGYSVPMIVVRFCGERIGVTQYPSAAERIADVHNRERFTVVTTEFPFRTLTGN